MQLCCLCSQIAEPNLLLGSRTDVRDQVGSQPLPTWMWGGLSLQDALRQFVQTEVLHSGVQICPVELPGRSPSPWPENRESALGR